MLIRFRAENSHSFRQLGEISLVRSSLKGPNVADFPVPQMGSERLLPCALIYGANASGKSNFLRAFSFFRAAILNSHSMGDPDGGVPRTRFELSDDTDRESTLEADFVSENVRYTFGFSCNDKAFTEEWLYSFPEGKKRVLYERKDKSVDFGSKFLGPKKQLVDFMRSNSLFISTATQNDHPELSGLVKFFRGVSLIEEIAVPGAMINHDLAEEEVDPRVIGFLGFVGTGISNYQLATHEMPDEFKAFSRGLMNLAKKSFGGKVELGGLDEGINKVLKLSHFGEDGAEYFLDIDRESSGTRRLIYLMKRVFRALDSGGVLFVDEVDASLHSLAAEEIVKLFLNADTNPNGAQLIATTHDTNLLSCSNIRRDQIWFCERGEFGASELYSLAEISSRPTDNFEKGYLEGRYGAIPYSGDVGLLFGGGIA